LVYMMVREPRVRKGVSHSPQPKNLVTTSQHGTMGTIRCWVTGMLKMETSITSGASQHLIGQQWYRDYNRNQKKCRKAEGMLTKRLILASSGVRKRCVFLFFRINVLPVEPCRECVLMSPPCVMCFPFGKPLWLAPFVRGTDDEICSGL
jgi:hypothetical protein